MSEKKPMFDVEEYIRGLKYVDSTDYEKTLVAGNLRTLASVMEAQFESRIAALERVAKAAFELWRMNRPIAWSQKEHLENPEINATSDAEKVLCRAVAEFIKEPPHAQH